jgi:hypothetical protein
MASDTSAVEDTAALAVIQVPKNINFDFNAAIKKFSYDNIKGDNLKGHIIVKDGILSIRETGLNILGGAVTLNADYDTRDTLNPMMKADFAINNIGVKDAYNTFNTIQKLAPAAEGIEGKINVNLTYESILDADMMPVVNTIEGFGKLQSDEVTLVKSAAYDKMKEVLKLSDKYSNTFRDINVSFKISKGRVYVSPFDVKVGNIKMNIGGDQGLDQTMNYLIKTEIPRADLGSSVNSLIDNLSSLASSVGVKYKPSDIIKINVKVSGVFGKPVVMPVFGSGSGEQSSAGAGSVKESVKQLTGGAVDQGKEKLRQEAESKGDKLIQEAEARAVQIRVEAAKAAEKVKQEAAVQGQKLVDEAIARGIPKIIASKAGDKVKQEADKRANQLTLEADNQANKLVEEAKAQKQALIEKL